MIAALVTSITTANLIKGYCAPHLLCPKSLPVAWLEIPRAGCTSQKRLLSEVDNITWKGHGHTQPWCCQEEPKDRIKYAIVRNPYIRLLSLYNHKIFCSQKRAHYCKQRLSRHNVHDFFTWVDQTMSATKADRFDKTRHFRTQLSYFWDKRLKLPYNISEFKIFKLETITYSWPRLLDAVCHKFGRCASYDLPAINKLDSNQHDLSLLLKNKKVLKKINEYFSIDFIIFGYEPIAV